VIVKTALSGVEDTCAMTMQITKCVAVVQLEGTLMSLCAMLNQ